LFNQSLIQTGDIEVMVFEALCKTLTLCSLPSLNTDIVLQKRLLLVVFQNPSHTK